MKDDFLDLIGYWIVRSAARIIQRLPAETALGAGKFFGRTAFFFSPRRAHAYADLKAAFGSQYTSRERWTIVRKHYEHIGQSAMEFLRFPAMDLKVVQEKVEIRGLERFQNTIAQSRGVLLLTAHFGNWELLQMVSSVLGKPIHALMREQKHSRLNTLLNEFREVRGSRVVRNRGMDLRDLVRALRRGELVGVLADQSAGKQSGIILPFFGRKTTVPTGSFEIASRTGALLLPAFISRKPGGGHLIQVEKPIECPEGEKDAEKLQKPIREYLDLVEHHVRQNPEQWLWAKKRWKYAWTKRLLILSDGKPGHFKQSQAIAKSFRAVKNQYGRPDMEYPLETIQVEFRSAAHRILFQAAALFFIPWAQGRLSFLKFFIRPECAGALEKAGADFVISTGSSLVPLNLCLARENRAKSVVVMKPPFPYNLWRYDLAVVPAHDTGLLPEGTIRTLLTPSAASSELSDDFKNVLAGEIKNPEDVAVSVFLGGGTRRYQMLEASVRKVFEVLEEKAVGSYLVTTSRRTPPSICQFLKSEVAAWKGCQKVIIASEDSRGGVVESMTALARVLVVTEDSISMISEAVSSGKGVIVLGLGETSKLPVKHQRFLKLLEDKKAVVRARVSDFENTLKKIQEETVSEIAEQEKKKLQEKLQEIL